MGWRCACGSELDIAAALDALPRDGIGSSGLAGLRCSGCGASVETRLHGGGYTVGYSYAAGGFHFEPVQRVQVRGMTVTATEPDGLEVRIGTRIWTFSVDRPSRLRCAVLPGTFAAGKPLSQLDFTRFGVVVEKFERDSMETPPEPVMVLAAGDFLHLLGPAPALTRAWRYLCEG
jgi:hypothetical protein